MQVFNREFTLRNMSTPVIAQYLMLLLNCMLIADALNLTYSSEFHDINIEFKNNCVTNGWIICEKGLVEIGMCCTKANHQSDVNVYGPCPYTILTDQVIYNRFQFRGLFHNYYHVNFTAPDRSCSALNRKGLLCSECHDGYGPAVYAFANECIKCHGSAFGQWMLYLCVVLFPVTIFYVIVIIFNIQATSPPFAACVCFH